MITRICAISIMLLPALAAQATVTGCVHDPIQHGAWLQTSSGCIRILPPDNPWNQRIDNYPVHPSSANYIKSVGLDSPLHADFGGSYHGQPIGFPYHVIRAGTPRSIVVLDYAEESDRVPYPIPPNPRIEAGGDRHLLVIDFEYGKLYELYNLRMEGGHWHAGAGAVFDLRRNLYRPKGYTSADAAGLPIFPGLVRYDEVQRGEIRHAIRVTVPRTQRGFVFPARHFASRNNDPALPPMGLRLRLRKDFDTSRFPRTARIILDALKRYGMIVADNGGAWFISGTHDSRWDEAALATLRQVKGRDFEAIYSGPIEH